MRGIWMRAGFVLALVASWTAAADATRDALVKRLAQEVDANQVLADKTKAFIKAKLLPQCSNPVLVAEAAAQDAKKVSLAEIKRIDAEWIAAEDELPIHKEKTSNVCAKEIAKFAAATPAVIEAFAMDDQGANVGQNALTSDYWQGDEPKWENSFNQGKGGLDVGKAEFDKSANAQLQQVSLPLVGPDGKVVGAITFGVVVDKL